MLLKKEKLNPVVAFTPIVVRAAIGYTARAELLSIKDGQKWLHDAPTRSEALGAVMEVEELRFVTAGNLLRISNRICSADSKRT
jgi:hypothetical protein